MHGVSGSTSSFAVKIETLDKDTVVAKTTNPDVTLALEHQLNSLSNVKPTKTITAPLRICPKIVHADNNKIPYEKHWSGGASSQFKRW